MPKHPPSEIDQARAQQLWDWVASGKPEWEWWYEQNISPGYRYGILRAYRLMMESKSALIHDVVEARFRLGRMVGRQT